MDTNVVIDFYDQRDEFYYPAAIIFDLAYKGKIQLYVSATTFVNAFFLLRKSYSRADLYKSMTSLASLCIITGINSDIIKRCLSLERKDFEDSVQYESALLHQVDVIVTRNIKDFKDFASNVQSPTDIFITTLKQKSKLTEMKRLSILSILLLACIAIMAGNPVKVACVGNSITYGAFIPNREENSYPAQLQAYLGSGYDVRNFGVSGSTLLHNGDHPYVATNEYKESQSFCPDIVIIKLGTNDTKPQNWKYKSEFAADYQALIDTYKKLASHPRVILVTPLHCFLPAGSEISGQTIDGEVRPLVEEMAWKNDLEIINLNNIFGNQWDESLMPDRLHPSAIGAGEMAQKIGGYIIFTQNAAHGEADIAAIAKDARRFNFHGYQGYVFRANGAECKIVKPAVEAKGRPWVLRARFWGHEPQTDIDLLERGFHIAYCDVADLYGADKAVKRWNAFYKTMVKAGFSKKVVLEGMSRGGLIVYHWAVKNAGKVACIYADAPVMDFKSWPMQHGKLSEYAEDTKKLLAAYGFADEKEALQYTGYTIRKCAQAMAKAGIPILHVVGDADDVVPVSENTAVFEHEMSMLNVPITVIHKPGIGHHPHSLSNPKSIVRFILAATCRLENECIHAVPGNEYRGGAGWTNGSEWHSEATDIKSCLNGRQLKLLLLGNSITQGWGGTRKAVTYKPGKEAMDAQLGEGNWKRLVSRATAHKTSCGVFATTTTTAAILKM